MYTVVQLDSIVSIIIPTHNRASLILDTLNCPARQTFPTKNLKL
jgi:glycosyltransferase involved in cell wall biosynthesis